MGRYGWKLGWLALAGCGWLVLGGTAASAQELIRAVKPIGPLAPSLQPLELPATLHVTKPCGPYAGGPELVGAWTEDPTTPQVPTPPLKKDEATAPPATAPLPGMDGDSMGDTGGDTVSTFDSAVGYIDDPIPGTYVRVRFDGANRNNRPSRAEYFYAKGGPFGPGLPTFAGDVDFETVSLYVEGAIQPWFSVFLDTPWRFIDPQFESRHEGFSDLSAGLKYAFVYEPKRVTTFQLRTWAPTGDARRGLGNNHATIEPGVLFYRQLTPKLRAEGEFLYWIPLGGTDFAGSVIQYGLGFSYGERPQCQCWLCPVVEFVGWTVLGGKQQVAPPLFAVEDAAGDTIVNAKVGFRGGFGDRWSAYIGYGRALTGDVWYENIVRAELRIGF